MVLYQICVFGADRKLNMAARAKSGFKTPNFKINESQD
jgi:hypothetical protein